jgi:hypothetical protein
MRQWLDTTDNDAHPGAGPPVRRAGAAKRRERVAISMIRRNFDDDWTVLRGELHPPIPRNTAKTGSAGGPSDLSLDEGGRLPLPERIAARLGEDLLREFMGGAEAVRGEWDPVRGPAEPGAFTLSVTAPTLVPASLTFGTA